MTENERIWNSINGRNYKDSISIALKNIKKI